MNTFCSVFMPFHSVFFQGSMLHPAPSACTYVRSVCFNTDYSLELGLFGLRSDMDLQQNPIPLFSMSPYQYNHIYTIPGRDTLDVRGSLVSIHQESVTSSQHIVAYCAQMESALYELTVVIGV
jgi:hypothetical protein